MNLNKEEIIFITDRDKYIIEGIEKEGYKCYRPYREKSLVDRVSRELWFRSPVNDVYWFNKEILNSNPKYIFVHDPKITVSFLEWLQDNFCNTTIFFMYCNLVGNARHITPEDIPEGISVWTYDEVDSKRYGINKYISGGYFGSYIGKRQDTEYDVFFVGKDKGRGEKLLELENKLNNEGLRTKFIITKDGRLAKRKKYYSTTIDYKEVVEYDNKSKAILNIVMPGQEGATMRDYEALYNGVKLITTNVHATNFDFYNEQNIFILGRDNFDKIVDFVNSPYVDIDQNIKDKHLFDNQVVEIITACGDICDDSNSNIG